MTGRVWSALGEDLLELGPEPGRKKNPWKHWRLTQDADGIGWLILDRKDVSANTLSEEALRELNAAIETAEGEDYKGLVLRSAKRSGFMMGADISEFGSLAEAAEIEAHITDANAVFDRLAALKIPTVSVIHGFCLGGGLELALTCDHRIAVDGAKFGFPEILLGLHPGLGGTVRSTGLIDPTEAMKLMLTGRTVDARKARKLGLVDSVTEERHILSAVADAISGGLKRRSPGLSARILSSGPGRRLAARRMRGETAKKARREHYPAPYALIDLWATHGDDPKAMKKAEIASFAKLLASETSRNLVRAFFLREGLKKNAGDHRDVRHVHVIGAGAMGGEIAAWCAWQGLRVSLADMKPEPLAGAVKRAARLYDKIGRGDGARIRDALDRLIPDLDGHGVAQADVVIEAVPEQLDLKRKIFASVEPQMKADAILATNTSSIELGALVKGLKRPERFLGLHFFNPVSKMQLVEVVSHDKTHKDARAAGNAFVGRIGRLPAPVKSAPGFLVNRALMPYLVEALALYDEGVKPETIDEAAERFGMPMGPIELADQVGLDICVEVAEVLRANLDRPMLPTPDWLKEKVAAGELGRKTGKGLYDWKDDKPDKDSRRTEPDPGMTDRLILPMVDVCVACLREGIVADEDTIDGAMIFATGFAPFRGGPLHYARSRGTGEIKRTLEELAKKHGERFNPDPGWDDLK
jgi:3-hydroxyacyl-CoA dehydrogenase / enoyl-CoA hydratase / 3-hydroxybutyryl-CoA epimerase